LKLEKKIKTLYYSRRI